MDLVTGKPKIGDEEKAIWRFESFSAHDRGRNAY